MGVAYVWEHKVGFGNGFEMAWYINSMDLNVPCLDHIFTSKNLKCRIINPSCGYYNNPWIGRSEGSIMLSHSLSKKNFMLSH